MDLAHDILSATAATAAPDDATLAVGADFWSDFNRGTMLSYYFVDALARLVSEHRDDDDDEAFHDELTALVQGMGYGIASPRLLDEAYAAASAASLAFWDGDYLLDLGGGASARLHIAFGQALLRTDGQEADEFRFADGVLELSGPSLSARLAFPRLASLQGTPAAPWRAPQAAITGSLTLQEAAGTRVLEVKGRRGCEYLASVQGGGEGDAAAFWAGAYDLVLTEARGWTWLDERLELSAEAGRLTATFGGRVPVATSFASNLLILWFDAPRTDGLIARFGRGEDGSRRLQGVRVDRAASRPMAGYASQPGREEHPLRRAALAVVRDAGGHEVGLDRSSVALTWPATAATAATGETTIAAGVELPAGNEGSPYRIQLALSDPGHAGATYSWRISTPDANYPAIVDLAADDATGAVATLRGAFGQTENAGFLRFTIEITRDGGAICEFPVTLAVLSLPLLAVSNDALPPVTRGYDYVTTLRASGGKEPYTWKVAIPDELKDHFEFTPSTGRLEGCVKSLSKAQAMYSIPVSVYADTSVVMSPAHDTLHLKVEEPEQVGTGVTGWFQFVFESLAAGGALLVLGQWIYGRHKLAREGKKPDPLASMSTEMKQFNTSFLSFLSTEGKVPLLTELLATEAAALDRQIAESSVALDMAETRLEEAVKHKQEAKDALKLHEDQHGEKLKADVDAAVKKERERLEADVKSTGKEKREAERARDRHEAEKGERERRKERFERFKG